MKTITAKAFSKYGIDPKNYKPNKYEMSYYIKPNVCDSYHADIIENYVLGILNGSIKSKYTTGNTIFDGMVDLFFDKDNYHKPEMEVVLFDMSHMANVLKRQIFNKNLSFSETLDARLVRGALFTNGKYKGGPLLKVISWFTIHSFLTGMFIVPESCYEIMRTVSSSDTAIVGWNDAVNMMDDIGVNMKAYFTIDPISKTCGFMDEYTPDTIKERRKNLIDETMKAESEHPEDDVEIIFDESSEKNKSLDEMFIRKTHEAEREPIIVQVQQDPKREVTFVAPKHVDEDASNLGSAVKPEMKEAITFGDVIGTKPTEPEKVEKAKPEEPKVEPKPEKPKEVVESIPVEEQPKKESKPKSNNRVVFRDGRIRVI